MTLPKMKILSMLALAGAWLSSTMAFTESRAIGAERSAREITKDVQAGTTQVNTVAKALNTGRTEIAATVSKVVQADAAGQDSAPLRQQHTTDMQIYELGMQTQQTAIRTLESNLKEASTWLRRNFNLRQSKAFLQLQQSAIDARSAIDGFRRWESNKVQLTVPPVGPAGPVFEVDGPYFPANTNIGDVFEVTARVTNNREPREFAIQLVISGMIDEIDSSSLLKAKTTIWINKGETIPLTWKLKTVTSGKGGLFVTAVPLTSPKLR